MTAATKSFLIFALVLFLFACHNSQQPPMDEGVENTGDSAAFVQKELRHALNALAASHPARVGVAFMHLERGDTLTINGDSSFRMQSVYKFPQALWVMSLVDDKKLSLGQKLKLGKEDIYSRHNVIYEKYPKGGVELTVSELLLYTMSNSDNNSSELLFKHTGGAEQVEKYVQAQGIMGFIFHEDSTLFPQKYVHTTRPFAIVQLLAKLHEGSLLTGPSTLYLIKMMEESVSGPNRIKGLLPEGTPVAHKTGTDAPNDKGFTPHTNDVGIISLPNGEHIALAVFISDAQASLEDNEKLIAEIAKLVFEAYR